MMKCIFYKKTEENANSNKRLANLTYSSQILNEDSKLKNKLLSIYDNYIELDESEIPKPKCGENQGYILYYNIGTNQLEYEYYDLPKTEEQILKERVTLLENALNDLLLGGI